MRLVTILALMAVAMAAFCSPAIPKDKKSDNNLFQNAPAPARAQVVAIQGGKRFDGWITDTGRFYIERNGKVVMNGWINRTGAATLYSTLSDDNYVGQVNPMGNGLLMSPKTSDTIRIEMQR